MQKKTLWSDWRFYFNKLYTLYEMLVLQFEKSRHVHPFPRLMMQFDDMILHVLLCSLSLVAKIITFCSDSSPPSQLTNTMTVAVAHDLNPGSWTMTTTGAWTDFFGLFLPAATWGVFFGHLMVIPCAVPPQDLTEFRTGVSFLGLKLTPAAAFDESRHSVDSPFERDMIPNRH